MILAARGWELLRTTGDGTGWLARVTRPAAHVCLSVGLVYGALIAWPWELRRLGAHPGDMDHVLPKALEALGIDHGIVFMRHTGRILKRGDAFNDYYAAGFIRNGLYMDGPLVFASNQRKDNELLMADPSKGPFYLYTFHRGTSQVSIDEYVREGESWQLKHLGCFPAIHCANER